MDPVLTSPAIVGAPQIIMDDRVSLDVLPDWGNEVVGLIGSVKSILLKVEVEVVILGFKLIILKFLILRLILPS